MTIEGIPDGWELVRIGSPIVGVDWVVNRDGTAVLCEVEHYAKNWPIIRKIEKPKRYRPFANAAEFEPFRDRWFCPKIKRNHLIKTSAYNEHRHWSGEEPDTWEKMFDEYVFDDGTPFGIEVTE